MKIGALTFFQRMHCNGTPSRSILLAAWHWKWSLTWRLHLSWSPGLSGRAGLYFMRTYRYKPWLIFHAGLNLPVIGSFSVQTQPNMPLTPNDPAKGRAESASSD